MVQTEEKKMSACERKERRMTDRQIELLKKALDLYEYSISQREYPKKDDEEFFKMREALSNLLKTDVRW